MLDSLRDFFSAHNFMPHGHCYLWRSDILLLNVGSDILIALSYFLIPFFLVYLVYKRKDLAFDWIFLMFATFIVACGTTHIFDVLTTWRPYYGLQGIVKLFTGIVSFVTAIALWRLLPRALALPSSRDLEQKNQALEALNIQLKHYNQTTMKQVVEAAPNGLLMINTKGEIVLCNAQIEKQFGYRREDLLGQPVEILIPERYRTEHPAYRTSYLANPTTRQMGAGRDLTGVRKDGTEVPVEIGLNPVKTQDGPFVIASIVDITERKTTALELAAAKEAAEAANMAKSSFLANMSHEIRTPLGAVLGFSELVIDPQIRPSEKANFVAAIKRNGELLSNIINDILDLSKIEAGKMNIETQEVALSEILTDTKTLLDLQAKDKGIGLTVTLDPGAPEVIRTDPLRLRQVLINIIGNAIKFTNKGEVSVNIRTSKHEETGREMLEFAVTDTGPGIKPEQADKLFTPFSQVDVSYKRKFGGTGLGLVLSKHFARLLGGDVVLTKSAPKQGSTFTVTIDPGPLRSVWHGKSGDAKDAVFTGTALPLGGIRILLAEDSPDNQILVTRILKLAGADVEVVGNGADAVEHALASAYDVVLMDLQMPIMDGYEATSELRKKGYRKKIVALTAHTLSEERDKCLSLGFDDHIGKPVNRKLLIEQIEFLTKKSPQ